MVIRTINQILDGPGKEEVSVPHLNPNRGIHEVKIPDFSEQVSDEDAKTAESVPKEDKQEYDPSEIERDSVLRRYQYFVSSNDEM